MGLLGRIFLLPLPNILKFDFYSEGVTLRTIWIESNSLTFNNTRWEALKHNKPFGKDRWIMQELLEVKLLKMQIGTQSMMAHSLILTKHGQE